MSSYVLWANKGGIGKSTLSFQLACKYARLNPDIPVVIIDLSPQCDVSRMVLGGGKWDGEQKVLDLMGGNPRKTIYQFLRNCVLDVPNGHGWPNAIDYLTEPNVLRSSESIKLPDNLRLLCGDFDLERITHEIDGIPQPPKRGGLVPSGAHYSKYLLPRSFLKKGVEQIQTALPGAQIFIDTDPYYSVVTTHLGLLAADYLITAYAPSSQASQYAVYRSLEFLHSPGYSLKDDVEQQELIYPKPWFDQRDNPLEAPTVRVPQLALLLSNMTTSKAAKGGIRYSQPQQLHRQTITEVEAKVRDILTKLSQPCNYKSDYVWSLQRLGLICDYNGIDMSTIRIGNKYPQPDNQDLYRVDRSEDNKLQVDAYNKQLEKVSKLI